MYLKIVYQTSNGVHVLHLRGQLSKAKIKKKKIVATNLKELTNLKHQLTSVREVVDECVIIEQLLNTLPKMYNIMIYSLSNASQISSLVDMSGQLLCMRIS
jgi:hypothetical protein